MDKLLCILPFYNEEKRITISNLRSIFQDNQGIDFLLVNDGSLDKTAQFLAQLQYKNVTILNLENNVGKAEAIRKGVLHADLITYDFIGYLDADFATPISEFLKLFEIIKAHSTIKIIMGSRIKLIGNKVVRSLKRHYFGRIFATFVSQFILKTPIYDTQCGAKIIKANIAKQLFKKPFLTKWLFDVELLLRLKNKQFRLENVVMEVPLFEWKEIANSKLSFIDFLKVPLQLISLYFNYVVRKI